MKRRHGVGAVLPLAQVVLVGALLSVGCGASTSKVTAKGPLTRGCDCAVDVPATLDLDLAFLP